jgi:protein N-terminal methyltransferase
MYRFSTPLKIFFGRILQMDKSLEYWQNAPATVDGVLGGMEHVHEIDIRESKAFLESLPFVGRARALDCAAGIGRISKHLLCPLFNLTDVLEPFEHMINRAKAELPPESVGEFLRTSMQQVVFRHTYDVIAIQWAAAYLTDDDLVSFLTRGKTALKPQGVIFLKDNVSFRDNRDLDADDNSQARSDRQYKYLFASAGLRCVKDRRQEEWPRDLFQAKMYALQ